MAVKIIAALLGLAALILTFRGQWILSNVFKQSEPSPKQLMQVKYVALGLAIIAFILVFRVG